MRVLVLLLFVAAAGVPGAACYDQPAIPAQHPLPCASDAAGECPTGFSCVAGKVCAPTTCRRSEDCPAGLVCAGRACAFPATDAAPATAADVAAPVPADAAGGRG